MTVHEINQELHSQLAKSEQDFQDLMEKFLVSQATTYSLAKELQKYSKSYRAMVTKGMNDHCLPSKILNTLQPLSSIPFVQINFILTTIQEK